MDKEAIMATLNRRFGTTVTVDMIELAVTGRFTSWEALAQDAERDTMTVERLVKRTVYVAQCPCGTKQVVEKDPPRETLCPKCSTWVPYVPESYTGPDHFGK
jgi:hypothetical protein